MGVAKRWKRIVKLAVLIPLVAGAVIILLLILFRGTAGNRAAVSTGDNRDYPLPGKDTSAGEAVSSATLVENANAWNDRVIRFTGEAIGERMIRGEMAWIHLNDDPYQKKNIEEGGAFSGYNSGQAVWLSAGAAAQITVFGDYWRSGDIVTVTGVFSAACREHGGDMDIHADSLHIIAAGHPVSHPFNPVHAFIAGGICLAAGGLFVLRRFVARE